MLICEVVTLYTWDYNHNLYAISGKILITNEKDALKKFYVRMGR